MTLLKVGFTTRSRLLRGNQWSSVAKAGPTRDLELGRIVTLSPVEVCNAAEILLARKACFPVVIPEETRLTLFPPSATQTAIHKTHRTVSAQNLFEQLCSDFQVQVRD